MCMKADYDVQGKINLDLEKIYTSTLNKREVTGVCLEKWERHYFLPFQMEVLASIAQSINTATGLFLQNVILEYIRNAKDENGKNLYVILPECEEGLEVARASMFNGDKAIQSYHIDLLFKEVKTGEVYYFKICKQDYFRGSDKSEYAARFHNYVNNLIAKYRVLNSYILFVEEEEMGHFYDIQRQNIMTGKEFFDRFLHFDISELHNLMKSCQETVRVDALCNKCKKWITEFETIALKDGPTVAYNYMNKDFKKVGNTSIGM